MFSAPVRWLARLAVLAVATAALAGPASLLGGETPSGVAAAAVRSTGTQGQPAPSTDGANALQDAAERAGRIARGVALSLIGLALAAASVILIFRRDFKEAAAVFAVGLLAVLLATPSGLSLLRSTAALIFGGQ
jgi:hypothetical protein